MGATAPVMRLRRPRWRDPRLIVGIVLVVASVLMGALLVSRLSETTPVLIAKGPIAPGDPLDAETLTTVELRLGDQQELYVGSLDAVPEGAVASRAVQAGEMLPVSAVGQPEDVALRPVVIPVDASVAESVVPGATVELWHTSPAPQDGGSGEARLLVEEAIVRRVDEGSSLGMRSMSVEVLVPQESVAEVLQVLAEEERLDVIGVPGAYGVTP
ncbi:SAF domain-containing protein [Brachybacterium sp. J144]|uniref:SAF domain-containing protein n=1 Tax=Brachybacterium sp. J144 TaxID=3116487 RepID=UPI002E785E43|nr:SAF domain-containing protein [Brachybacterium sp. J144]MEE1649617.1 SAF domain-containing protein [Brachybacterium sp. J144]